MFQNLCLVCCALCFAQNPFLQDACFKYSPQIMCFLVWTALLYKVAYARGRAAREAEHAAEIAEFQSCITQLVQHCQNVSNNFEAVAAASANGCTIVWHK